MKVHSKVKDHKLIDEKRARIIQGAIRVFREKGYHKATVREIAEEAGIGLGSIYDYVQSKDDILFLFFQNYVKAFHGRIKELCPPELDPITRLQLTYRAFVESAIELDDQVMLAYTQAMYVRKDYLKVILKQEAEIVEHFQGIIEEALGGSRGLDSFLEANLLVFTGVLAVIRRWILRPERSAQEIVDFLMERMVGDLVERIRRLRPQDREETDEGDQRQGSHRYGGASLHRGKRPPGTGRG
jgi:AcrR family transcriptional regulator